MLHLNQVTWKSRALPFIFFCRFGTVESFNPKNEEKKDRTVDRKKLTKEDIGTVPMVCTGTVPLLQFYQSL